MRQHRARDRRREVAAEHDDVVEGLRQTALSLSRLASARGLWLTSASHYKEPLMRRLFLVALLAGAGCNGSGSGAPIIHLAVDADRNGTVDVALTSKDVTAHSTFDATTGAVFLANVDDDDGDKKVDATDSVVNGPDDEADLARIRVVAWPKAPKAATATVAIDMASSAFVHLFRHNADGSWTAWDPASATLTGADLAAGVEFGIEATDFANPMWSGQTTISYAVTNGTKMLGSDAAVLQVAPLLLQSNLGIPDTAYATSFAGDPDSDAFMADLQAAADAAMVPLTQIDGSPPYDDQWTQDLFEVGWTGMPGHTMYVVIRTPETDRPAADYTQNFLLGKDFGWVWKHSDPYAPPGDSESLDSFGNLDAIPPYKNGGSNYPFGRVLIGSTPQRHMDDALRDFLNAQKVQGPNFYIDTTWLYVGHVDEVLSFAQASTPRGFKLLLASPSRARQLLTDLVAKDAANGNLMMFAGQQTYDASGANLIPAQLTVNALLADPKLMTANQTAQTKIDAIRAALKTEIGLADDEIVDLPVFFEDVGGGAYLAYSPGIVNQFNIGGRVAPPKAHSVTVANADLFQSDFETAATALGLKVSWTEDWNLYHINEGEVHCGSNVTRKVPMNANWWEVQR
jgi:protein-arginine deiminase